MIKIPSDVLRVKTEASGLWQQSRDAVQ